MRKAIRGYIENPIPMMMGLCAALYLLSIDYEQFHTAVKFLYLANILIICPVVFSPRYARWVFMGETPKLRGLPPIVYVPPPNVPEPKMGTVIRIHHLKDGHLEVTANKNGRDITHTIGVTSTHEHTCGMCNSVRKAGSEMPNPIWAPGLNGLCPKCREVFNTDVTEEAAKVKT